MNIATPAAVMFFALSFLAINSPCQSAEQADAHIPDMEKALLESHQLDGLNPKCVIYSVEVSTPTFVEIGVFEDHEPPCPGERLINHRLLSLRYDRSRGTIYLIDFADPNKLKQIGRGTPWSAPEEVRAYPSRDDIISVAQVIAKTVKDAGIVGLSQNVQQCYDNSKKVKSVILHCTLLDVSIIKLDNVMRKAFVARGMNDPGPGTRFLSSAALQARMEIYSSFVFGPSNASAMATYLGESPTRVLNEVDRLMR